MAGPSSGNGTKGLPIPTTSPKITVTIEGAMGFITLDDPKTLNSISIIEYDGLADSMEYLNGHSDVLVIVWRAMGRLFSAGANLSARGGGADKDVHRPTKSLRRKMLAKGSLGADVAHLIYTSPKITVAALNGGVVGIISAFLGHFDLVYATPTAWLATPFSSLGIVAEGGSSFSFPQKLGINKANEVLLFGKKITAPELRSVGFVNHIFDPSPSLIAKGTPTVDDITLDFHAQVTAHLLDRLDGLDPKALLATKKLLRQTQDEQNDPRAGDLREQYALVERYVSGEPDKRFSEIGSGKRRHKL